MVQKAFFLLRLNDHVLYLKRIQATLEGTGDFQGTDYHECKLGKWLYGEGSEEADALGPEAKALFESLFEPHQQFHEASRHAVDKHAAGDVGIAVSGATDAARAAATEMHKLSTVLVNKLLTLDQMVK